MSCAGRLCSLVSKTLPNHALLVSIRRLWSFVWNEQSAEMVLLQSGISRTAWRAGAGLQALTERRVELGCEYVWAEDDPPL